MAPAFAAEQEREQVALWSIIVQPVFPTFDSIKGAANQPARVELFAECETYHKIAPAMFGFDCAHEFGREYIAYLESMEKNGIPAGTFVPEFFAKVIDRNYVYYEVISTKDALKKHDLLDAKLSYARAAGGLPEDINVTLGPTNLAPPIELDGLEFTFDPDGSGLFRFRYKRMTHTLRLKLAGDGLAPQNNGNK